MAIRKLNACQHLVRIFEILREDDNKVYFVLEYMPDGTLTEYLARLKENGGSMEEHRIKSMLRQVLSGLEHIHACGFIHRDIKPEVSESCTQ